MAGWIRQKTFAVRVWEKLKRQHWTAADLAVMVGCSTGYLHRVLRGLQEPSWSLAVAMARALGVTTDELADDWENDRDACPFCGRQWQPIQRKQ